MAREKLSRGYMGKLVTTSYNKKTDKFTYTIRREGTLGAILRGDKIRVPIWEIKKKKSVFKTIRL